jgi:hypothetical protein
MSPEVIEQMRKLGVVVDMQPAWLERDGGTLRDHFGEARMRYFHPYKSLLAAGVVVGGGSDHMQKIGSMRSINPYNPFYGMWVTLARQPRWTNRPLHTEERISREQAIRLYTINTAILLFGEKDKGSLEAGKLADFIVLDQDILTCPLDQVKSITVAQTWVGGKQVYDSKSKPASGQPAIRVACARLDKNRVLRLHALGPLAWRLAVFEFGSNFEIAARDIRRIDGPSRTGCSPIQTDACAIHLRDATRPHAGSVARRICRRRCAVPFRRDTPHGGNRCLPRRRRSKCRVRRRHVKSVQQAADDTTSASRSGGFRQPNI